MLLTAKMREKLIHRYTYIIILLINLDIMYIMHTYLTIISLLVTCGDQYKLVKWYLQYAIILEHCKYLWSIIAMCVEIYV